AHEHPLDTVCRGIKEVMRMYAALDQLVAVLAAEEPGLRVWAVDPGDMATDLYAAAVPEDREPRPEPAAVVPGFLRLLDERPASGRYGAPALLDGAR
ncbi:hypothetical protein ABZ281_47290, partial [Streptomyces sp. NPDC006265]